MIAESCRWLRPLSELLTTPLQPSLLLAHNIDNIGIIIIANFAKFNIAIPCCEWITLQWANLLHYTAASNYAQQTACEVAEALQRRHALQFRHFGGRHCNSGRADSSAVQSDELQENCTVQYFEVFALQN